LNTSVRLLLTLILLLSSIHLPAQSWNFSKPVNVTAPAEDGVFHHLESSGRRNIAVSGNTVGIVWEDDSDGTPRIYLARKTLDANEFDKKIRISANGDAYEPSIIALGDGLFALAWEEGEQISSRIAAPEKMGPIVKLGDKASAQVSLAHQTDRMLLAYRTQAKRFGQIMLQELKIDNQLQLNPVKRCSVDTEPLKNDQLYPVITWLENRVHVAWEDRRLGHTVIMYSQSKADDTCGFASATRISEEPPGPKSQFGSGHGVARVTLASYASSLYAVWADKRNFQEGYDIYGASQQNAQPFGANVRIQDDFGTNYHQWHATAAGHQNGQLVTAWTDDREGTMDIWYSWLEDGEWSDDNVIPGASGKGIQYHPAITLDRSGNLHVAWIHREVDGGPTQIRYSSASIEQGKK
jgi:hypothetical protein